MTKESTSVKKESLVYALLIGFVAGFIVGAIFAVYKLGPSTPNQPTVTQNAASPAQPDNQTLEAIKNMEAQVTANPDNAEAWTRLGHLYFDSDQPVKAIKAYSRSLELMPGNPDVLTDLGVMYRRNKQPDKAIESFEKAYSIQNNHVMARINKGIVLLYDLNKPEEAIATWEELLAIDPEAKLNNGMPLIQAIEEIKKEMNKEGNKPNNTEANTEGNTAK
jgi:cytochrome c-type biogenesis protein CcmH/NrfG